MARPRKYPDELIQRGVRIALEGDRLIAHIAHDLGFHPETLRKRVRQAEADSGKRTDLLSTQEREEIRRLRKRTTSCAGPTRSSSRRRCFRARARPRPTEVSRYIDEHRGRFGVEPICRTLGVSHPPTTSAPRASVRVALSRTSGCWAGSASCTG
jgi:transposase